MNREVGLSSHSPARPSPVPDKPYGFCGRKAPCKKKKLLPLKPGVDEDATMHVSPTASNVFLTNYSLFTVVPASFFLSPLSIFCTCKV